MSKYLILSKERSALTAIWWKPAERGYTQFIEEAGRYSEDEARRIVADSRGQELMIPEAGVVDGKLTTYTLVDMEEDNNRAEIEGMGKAAWEDAND